MKVRKIITGEGAICKPRGKFMLVPRMDFEIRKLWETLTTLKAFKICNQRTKIRDSGTLITRGKSMHVYRMDANIAKFYKSLTTQNTFKVG